jgi:arginine deiminase
MNVSQSKTTNILAQFGVGVQSECGKLDIVLMHRPGRELLRLTKDNLHYLLYDAVPNINETHQSHDIFSQYLRDNGVHVLYLADLLRETLVSSEEACKKLIDGIIAHSHFSNGDQNQASTALREWLDHRTPEQLAISIIAGVAGSKDELGVSDFAQTLLQMNNPINEFIIPPLPNLLYMRDGFSIIEKNVFIWQMAKPARRNEPLLLHAIFQYHPYLSNSGLKIVEWKTTNDLDEYPTIEGGDVAYLGNGVVLIGCSERTNRAGIEALARTDLFRQVIAVIIPPQRYYMHLDTVLSSVGKHAFTLHGPLAETMEVFTVENRDSNNNIHTKPEWVSYGCNVPQAFRKLLNDPKLIFYDALDTGTSVFEQRQCRHNVVVIDDYHVVTYAGSDPEKGIVTQMTRDNICRVGQIPPQGLSEGGGGVHCMTNAIRRRAK